jgi:predicted transcriptional regulator
VKKSKRKLYNNFCYITYLVIMTNKILIVKIGGSILKDINELKQNSKQVPNSVTTYLDSLEELPKLFTKKRLKLLNYLMKDFDQNKTITQISKDLNRKQEALSRDLIALEKKGFIIKTKEKQKVFPKTNFEELRIILN